MIKIGSGGKQLFQVVTILEIILIVACLALAIRYDFSFLIPILAVLPGILLVMSLSFISFARGQFVIERLFRHPIKVDVAQYELIDAFYLSIPFSNTLRIRFKNGSRYIFSGGGRSLNQIRGQVKSIVDESNV